MEDAEIFKSKGAYLLKISTLIRALAGSMFVSSSDCFLSGFSGRFKRVDRGVTSFKNSRLQV